MTEFNKELLQETIKTGNNAVFSFPAGSGKTTAICEYIVEQIRTGKLNRKIIYVAPTKSLLDAMYKKLLETGVSSQIIFNYHSSSPDYKACCNQDFQQNIDRALRKAIIVLITHERMKFEAAKNFLTEDDLNHKPLIFLDESIDDCNVASMYTRTLKLILRASGLISSTENQHDYLNKQRLPIKDRRAIYDCLTELDENGRICHLEALGITLADTVGFSNNSDMTSQKIVERHKNLYMLIAMSISEGNWLEVDNQCFIKVPVAIHESWKGYAQIVIMDATAFVNACLCSDFELITSNTWNSHLLNNYVQVSKDYTRTKLEKDLSLVTDFLAHLDLHKYNNIYMVTFKGKIMNTVLSYLKLNYPEYKIENFDNKETLDFINTDIDNTTDELFSNSDANQKRIYLTNFGQTRGSNKFRECECVVQIGSYRLNPEVIQTLNLVYKELTSNKLTLTHYLQELYRGRIRCNQTMDSFALLEKPFYTFLKKETKPLGFSFSEYDPILGFKCKQSKPGKQVLTKFGMNQNLVDFLYKAKSNGTEIHKKDLLEVCKLKRWDKVKNRLLNLYRKHESLRNEIFNLYKTESDLKEALTPSRQSANIVDFQIKL